MFQIYRSWFGGNTLCLGECGDWLRDFCNRHDVSLETFAKASRKEELARTRQLVVAIKLPVSSPDNSARAGIK
jgi:hypothetical protein